MSDERVAVLGDVHGRADLLRALIDAIYAKFGAVTLYCTGDLIDRGPDSKKVLDICVNEEVHSVLGNHETWLHQYLTTGQFDSFALHRIMAGDVTLRSYGLDTKDVGEIERRLKGLIPEHHRRYILSTPVWQKFTVGGQVYRVSHAGLKKIDARQMTTEIANQGAQLAPDVLSDALCEVIAKAHPACVLWVSPDMKNPDLYHFPDGSCQVFGHTPVREPIITKPWIALDTGCGTRPPQNLSAVILPDREVMMVNDMTSSFQGGPGHKDLSLD